MAKKLLVNEAAEREANEVAERFMNSADVLRDMRGEYGSRLDALRLHDDEEAQEKVRAVRRDAVASGRDIYFGRGILQSRAPEAKGLIAHEVAHTMQQDGAGGMSERISFGEEQGGLISWFKKKFGKKKAPVQIVPSRTPQKNNYLGANESQKEAAYQKGLALEEASKANPFDADVLAKSTLLLSNSMRQRMQESTNQKMVWRADNSEQQLFFRNAERMLPEDFLTGIMDFKMPYTPEEFEKGRGEDAKEFITKHLTGQAQVALSKFRDEFENNPELVNYLAGGAWSFEETGITDWDEQAETLLNSFFLNAVIPRLTNTSMAIKTKNGGKHSKESQKYSDFSVRMQRVVGEAEEDEGLLAIKKQMADMLKSRFSEMGLTPPANAAAKAPVDPMLDAGSAETSTNRSPEEIRRVMENAGYSAPALATVASEDEMGDEDIRLSPEQERRYQMAVNWGYKLPRRMFAGR